MNTNPTANDVREAVKYLAGTAPGRLAMRELIYFAYGYADGLTEKDRAAAVCLLAGVWGSFPTTARAREEIREAMLTVTITED